LLVEYSFRITYAVAASAVPPSLIYALDQLGQRLLAVGNRTRVEKGTKSVPISGTGDKRQITGVPVVTMDADFVGVQAIWQGTTDRCHPSKTAPKNKKLFHAHSATHWSTVETMKRLVLDIIVPDMKKKVAELGLNAVQASKQKAILLLDVWKVHMMHEFKEFLMALNIEPHYLDPSMTSKGQGNSAHLLNEVLFNSYLCSWRSRRESQIQIDDEQCNFE
jgi:hypothetical protein